MPAFSLADVEASFRKVAGHVKRPVVAYVLGGAAMAKLGVKASTKDVDIALRTKQELEAFEAALVAVGAQRVTDPGGVSTRAGARRLWETPDGMGWDLFVGNVIGFQLVETDYATGLPWLHEARLEIRRLSPDLMFVMKAFTPRTRDIGDMADLLTSGAATAPGIVRVVEERMPLTPDRQWLSRLYHGVVEMGGQRGIDVRWADRFEPGAFAATAAPMVLEWLRKESLSTEELAKRLRLSGDEAAALLAGLTQRGVVRQAGDRWLPSSRTF